MRKIRSKGTRLDLTMKILLRKSHFSFRSYPKIYGNPDFMVGGKIIVFCDGSFWHGRHWKKMKQKLENGNNSEYWVSHIEKNKKRDRKVNRKLRESGYSVIRFWDTDVYKRPEWCVKEIRKLL